jgi:hypothetical protein
MKPALYGSIWLTNRIRSNGERLLHRAIEFSQNKVNVAAKQWL